MMSVNRDTLDTLTAEVANYSTLFAQLLLKSTFIFVQIVNAILTVQLLCNVMGTAFANAKAALKVKNVTTAKIIATAKIAKVCIFQLSVFLYNLSIAFIILQIVIVIRPVQPHSNVKMMENALAKEVLTDVSARYVPIPSTDILTADPVDVMM